MSKLGTVVFTPQDEFRQEERREIKAELSALAKNLGVWRLTIGQLNAIHHLSGGRWWFRCKDENGRTVRDLFGNLEQVFDFDVWRAHTPAKSTPVWQSQNTARGAANWSL